MMDSICKYNQKRCQLAFAINVYVNSGQENVCEKLCGVDDVLSQISMLRKFTDIPNPPTGVDLLDWIKEKVADGTITNDNLKRQRQNEAERIAERKKWEARQKQLLTEMPKGFELAENLARHLVAIHTYYKKTGRVKVAEAWREARLSKCRSCPDDKMVIKDGVMRCALKSCGCYLDNPKNRPLLGGKAEYEALCCDLGHWAEIDAHWFQEVVNASLTRR